MCYCGEKFSAEIAPLMSEYFSREKMLYHYYNMARNNNVNNSRDTIKPKEYFYILRPVLACLHVMEFDSQPPGLFANLCESVLTDSMHECVNKLLDIKINAPEKFEIEHIKSLENFLNDNMQVINKYLETLHKNESKSWDSLNKFFLAEIDS